MTSNLDSPGTFTWTTAVDGVAGRETGDPIGLRVWANQVASEFVPGLTNATRHVQAYGLLCAGLMTAEQSKVAPLGSLDTWLRFERLWILAQESHHAYAGHEAIRRWPGRRRAEMRLPKWSTCSMPLTMPLLGSQLSGGAWGTYRRSATAFGLFEPSGPGAGPGGMTLTSAGRALGNAWLRTNQACSPAKVAGTLARGEVSPNDAMAIFKPDGFMSGTRGKSHTAMTSVLDRAVRDAMPASHYERLAGLRRVWNAEHSLSIKALKKHRHLLTDHQQDLVPQIAAILWLHAKVERPFRRYLRDDKGAPEDYVWRSRHWRVAQDHSLEMRELLAAADQFRGHTWLGVQDWAVDLARRRGSRPIQVGSAPKGYHLAPGPAMSLPAAELLFSQGFLGQRMKSLESTFDIDKRSERSQDD